MVNWASETKNCHCSSLGTGLLGKEGRGGGGREGDGEGERCRNAHFTLFLSPRLFLHARRLHSSVFGLRLNFKKFFVCLDSFPILFSFLSKNRDECLIRDNTNNLLTSEACWDQTDLGNESHSPHTHTPEESGILTQRKQEAQTSSSGPLVVLTF